MGHNVLLPGPIPLLTASTAGQGVLWAAWLGGCAGGMSFISGEKSDANMVCFPVLF